MTYITLKEKTLLYIFYMTYDLYQQYDTIDNS